jgi:hypothetical protein
MEMFDQLVVTRFVTDEEQVQEIEFNEAQEAFCEASCRWADTKEQSALEKVTEAEVKLLHAFFRGDDRPIMRRAWSAYRRRLRYHHRAES